MYNIKVLPLQSETRLLRGDGVIPGGGHLLVGQNPFQGKFQGDHFLRGQVADLVLLNESLTVEEMKEYVACHGLPWRVQPLLGFDSALSKWEQKGHLLSYNLAPDDICGRRLVDSLVMFPHPVDQGVAASWCQWMGGFLPLPMSQAENEDITAKGSVYESDCRHVWSTVAWLGIRGNTTTKEWLSLEDGSPVLWDNFDPFYGTPYGHRTCALLISAKYRGLWYAAPCTYPTCALCQFAEPPTFTVRGLCPETNFDVFYTLGGMSNKRPMFIGHFESTIYWDGRKWILTTAKGEWNNTAYMADVTKRYPNGRNTWHFKQQECGASKVSSLLLYTPISYRLHYPPLYCH